MITFARFALNALGRTHVGFSPVNFAQRNVKFRYI